MCEMRYFVYAKNVVSQEMENVAHYFLFLSAYSTGFIASQCASLLIALLAG